MAFFRKVGKGVGTVSGGVIGGAVKLAGKAMKSEWVEEVGDGIKHASTIALDNAGQFIDGAVKGTYGVVKKDQLRKQEGISDLKDSSVRTLKGLGSTISYTAKNTGTAIEGLITGDKERSMQGVKNVGKVAAVTAMAVGALDLVDGADHVAAEELDTRNNQLAGDIHPETGVPFVEKTVSLPNGDFLGTFPVFESVYEVQLPENMYLQSDSVHFSYANAEMFEGIQSNPSLITDLYLSNADLQQLGQGNTPEGYTWHHHEESGVLQLVEEDVHHNTGHTGGRELWGGGAEFR